MANPTTSQLLRCAGTLGLLSGLALPMILGCTADGSSHDDTGQPMAGGDAAGADAGPGSDVGAVFDGGMDPAPARPPADLWLSSGRGQEFNADSFGDDATTCFDGVDNDASEGMDGVDCADPDCQALATCCVNDAACAGPAALVFENDFTGCVDAFCGGDFTIFGGAGEVPVIDNGTLAMMGDMVFDTGWYGNEALDLRSHRVDLEINFSLTPCGECAETAAVGLSAQDEPGANSVITPLVALRGIAAREVVQLIIHDRVVTELPAGDQSEPWFLSVRPDGLVEMRHGDTVETKQFVPSVGAHLVLYGHSTNPQAGGGGARLDAIKVERRRTDRVDAWGPTRSLERPGGRVSAARLDAEDFLAVAGEDSVQFYMGSDNTLLNWVFADGWENHGDHAIAEVEGVLRIYAVNADGALVYGAVDLETREITAPTFAFSPSDVGWEDLRRPVVAHSAGFTIVVAEVGGALAAAVDVMGTWMPFGGSLSERSAGGQYPSLVVHGSVYWLHYSVRIGTRESVRVLVSDQMFHWRDLGNALEGSGIPDSIDRFSVGSPAVVSTGESLRMYLTADDHIERRLGVTERRAPRGVR